MFEMFADSILPDFGLKRVESRDDANRRLAKERQEQKMSAAKIAPPVDAVLEESVRKRNLSLSQGLHRLNTTALASTEQQLRQAAPTPQTQDLLAAVQYELSLRPSGERLAAVTALQNNTVPTVGPLVLVQPSGIQVVAGVDPASALGASVSAIGTGVAPAKKGGAAGIIAAVADAAGAITSGITALDRLFAANPPDP